MTTRADVIRDLDELVPYLDEWDELAQLCRQPYSAPAWMLAWWRHVAPRHVRLAVTVVREGADVVGVAPWYEFRLHTGLTVARLMGTGHRVEPLAVPGRERQVAEAVAEGLRGTRQPPGALMLDRTDLHSPWPELFTEVWGRQNEPAVREVLTAPTLTVAGRTADQYLAGRSANFRSQRKRARRRLADQNAHVRLLGADDDFDAAASAFMRLHGARWNARGARTELAGGVERMLSESARQLVAKGRMRIWSMEANGTPVCVQVFLTAGGETGYWNGGFDPQWSELRPGFETLALAVEHACDQGDLRVDFGGGSNSYKTRLADGDEPLSSTSVVAGGRGHVVRTMQLLPARLQRTAVRTVKRLPAPLHTRVVHLRDALRR